MRVADVRVICVGLIIVGMALAARCISSRPGDDLNNSIFM